MTHTAVSPIAEETRQRWQTWALVPLERLPWSYLLTVALCTAIVLVEQYAEHLLQSPTLERGVGWELRNRLVLPLLTAYMLIVWRMLRGHTLATVEYLRSSVLVSDTAYERPVHFTLYVSRRWYASLFVLSLAIVVLLFVVLGNSLPIYGGVYLPSTPLLAGFIIAVYAGFGWIGLSLSYTAIRHSLGLGRMGTLPLHLNVLDPTNVLAFGRLSLAHSAALAGIVIVLLLSFGQPAAPPDFVIIFTALGAGLAALVLPLWGVHTQMTTVKQATLGRIHHQLDEIHRSLVGDEELSGNKLEEMALRTDKLVQFRNLALEFPNWPFRSAAAIIRALLAAASPLIYLILTQIVQQYVIPFLVD